MPSGEPKLGPVKWLIPALVRSLIRIIGWTVRPLRTGMEVLDSLEKEGKTAVLAFFHGRQFLLAYAMRGRKVGVMASLSRDGELQARVMSGLGYAVVRGSTSRGAARGLIGLMRLMRAGHHAAVAVDGPRGPLHQVKPGAVYLAKRSGQPLVLLASSARPARTFVRAWDRFLLPLPFSRGAVLIDGPFPLDEDLSQQAVERDCGRVQSRLLELQRQVDDTVGCGGR